MPDKIEPDDDETHSEWMDRCMDELGDDAECELLWDERATKGPLRKTHSAPALKIDKDGVEFVMSDESVDRMNDVIIASGWHLDSFRRNPVALFNHVSSFPIGKWLDVRVVGDQLRGTLRFAPAGTSDRIDEIRKLVEAGILQAVSVGFKPLSKPEPRDKDNPYDGYVFRKQELFETSLVSVPANANALAIAKSLNVSPRTLDLVFAGQGNKKAEAITRRITGGQADTTSKRKNGKMSLAQQITDTQGQINFLKDALQEHYDGLDNNNITEDDLAKSKEINEKLAHKRKVYDTLIESERNLGGTIKTTASEDGGLEMRMPTRRPDTFARPFALPQKKHAPGDYLWKSLVVLTKLQGDRYRKSSSLDVLRDTVGEDELTRAVFSAITGKAATVPALTSTVGWAQELVRTEVGGLIESLRPVSVYPALASRGISFSFGRNGVISLPMRSATPTIAGSFVGEGAPIPVRQGAFTAIQLVPKKLAVITVFSREISEHSDPAIEGILRDAIVVDTAVAIDNVLLDANPATAVRPAGLRNGVSTLTPTAGGGFAAVIGDLKQLVGALMTPTLGNVRSPVWLMPPALAVALSLTPTTSGDNLPFRDEIGRGMLLGWPTIVSASVTADTIYLIDAADFATVTGDEPRFDVSDSATVHMEDTTPLPIATTGTPNVVAAPVRSFWQTDTLGIRMLMQMNWAMLRPGMVSYITSPTWA